MRFPIVLTFLWLVDIVRADFGSNIFKDVETTLNNIAGRLNQHHAGQKLFKRAHSYTYYQQPQQYAPQSQQYAPQPQQYAHQSQQCAQSINYGHIDILNNYGQIGKRKTHLAQHSNLRSAGQKLLKRAHSQTYYQQPQQHAPQPQQPQQCAQNINHGDVNIQNNYGTIGKRITPSSKHSKLRRAENKSRRQYSSGGLSQSPRPQNVNYGDVTINTNYGGIGKSSPLNYLYVLYQQAVSHALYNPRKQLSKRAHYYQPPPQYAQNVNYGEVNIVTNYGPIGKRSPINYHDALYPLGTNQQHHQQPATNTTLQPETEVTTAQITVKPQPTQKPNQQSGTNNNGTQYVVYYNTEPIVAYNNYAPIG